MTLVINLPGTSGSKAQMVTPHGAVRAMVPVTLLVTPCSWRSLSIPGIWSAIPGVRDLHPQRLLGALSAEIAALAALAEVLAQIYSHRGLWFRPIPLEVPDLNPDP